MDLHAALPKPGVKVQVIGAGLPRTGTNSFCAALEILLDAPTYHVGVQTALGETEDDSKTWIEILKKRPYRTEADRQTVLKQMSRLLDGFVATADPPLSQLTPELMELYPDAIVICTMRDQENWADAMEALNKLVRPQQLLFIYYWVKNLRYCAVLWTMLKDHFIQTYGFASQTKEEARIVWERHHQWLREIVPKEKLFFVSAREGWEPLCKALDVPVPQGIPYPRLNDGESFEATFKYWAMIGLLWWAAVFIGLLAAVGMLYFWLRS